jgi:DNA modification methylase
VLRDDGSVWLNLGDSFAGSGRGQWDDEDTAQKEAYTPESGELSDRQTNLSRKSKMLIPHRVAIALQDAGWVVRSDAIWSKPNPMPHPVKDRLNEHKEFIFHLTPQPDYWFDLDAIREPHKEQSLRRRGRQDSPRGGEDSYGLPENSGIADNGAHPSGKNPGDVLEVSVKAFPEAHFAVYPPELCETPIKSSCPPNVCADCGEPYRRAEADETYLWERDHDDVSRPQAKRALNRFEQSDLTIEHMKAARAVGFGDGDHGDASQGSRDRVDRETRQLADEAKEVLGGYFREFVASPEREATGWESACDCETDETEPGIVLDPFAGAGTTCLVAKDLGRRFVGIDLNPEYVAMAQKRVGVTVDEPQRLLKDGETTLSAYTDGGQNNE